MDQCRLARRVSDAAAPRSDTGERSDVYDATGFVPSKFQRQRPCEQKRSAKVCFENPIPNLWRQCIKLAERYANVPPRIVDKNVKPPKMTEYTSNASINRFGISLVEMYGVAAPTSPSHPLNQLTSTPRLTYIGNRNIRARSGKSLGNCFSNVA
jgi:hypothetical protein